MILDHLLQSIRKAAVYYADVQEPPACILWPDRDRQWQAAIPQLQAVMPEIYVLGPFDPDRRTGPAIWLRCVIAGRLPDGAGAPFVHGETAPAGAVPVLYLPGFSRQDLRAVESCPEPIHLLAELQYRGVIWSQVNAKDWTLLAFLKSEQGGLGLDVALDTDAKNAMQLALTRLLEEDAAHLRSHHLDADYFNGLLADDPVRSMLQWLDQGDAFRASLGPAHWQAFVQLSKSQLAFDPENAGPLAGSELLARHHGAWRPVWDRFCEAPRLYPHIPDRIRSCAMPPAGLFAGVDDYGGWPQWNDAQEHDLRRDLQSLSSLPSHKARQRIVDLAQQHGPRCDLIWAELGLAPLARALVHLATIATAQPLAGGAVDDLAAAYQAGGWQADAALLAALAAVTRPEDVQAVTVALTAVYLPWAEESARHLQSAVALTAYPGRTIDAAPPLDHPNGVCLLFVDGLRFDMAQQLATTLTDQQYAVSAAPRWSALPSVTATAKPAVTPVRKLIAGLDAAVDFEPVVAATGHSLKGGAPLRKLLADAGWQLLDRSGNGDPQGRAWCEFADIDSEGHNRGWKLAHHKDALVGEICERIRQLLAAGWQRVHVVTDHGWLLFPGGLPKVDLPAALAENKWGRCAAIKPGAHTLERLFPWYWNPAQSFALADGISCFRAGMEYAHGGLSLQECLTLELSVSPGAGSAAAVTVSIADVSWRSQRCIVSVDGDPAGFTVDLRTQPGNDATSVADRSKPFREDGTASLVVEDEDLYGQAVTVVILDAAGILVAQRSTQIGGE